MPADDLLSPDGDHRIVFNLPFYSGRLLDSRKTLAEGAPAVQEKLQAIITERGLAGDWHAPITALRDSGLKRDVDNRRGITFAPTYLIERKLDRATLEALPDDLGCRLDFDDADGPIRLGIAEARIRLLESGFNSALFICRLELGEPASMAAIREFVEAVSSKLNCFVDLLHESTSIVDDDRLATFRLRQKVNERPHQKSDAGASLRLLWAHRIYLFEVPRIEAAERCEAHARQIVFRSAPGALVDASIRDDMAVFAGSGNSLLFAEKTVPMEERMLLARTVQMQNICWARAEDFDGDLFFYLNTLSLSAEDDDAIKRTIDKLESRSNDIVDLLENAALFRSTVEDYVYHLDPQSFVIWNALSDCWGTARRFDAIDHKLEAMERVYDRTRNSLKSLYDSQLNTLVFFFTAFTVLAVLVDLVQFVGERGSIFPIDILRLAMLAVGGIVIFLGTRFFLLRKRL